MRQLEAFAEAGRERLVQWYGKCGPGGKAIAAAGLIAASAGTAQASACSTARLPLPDASCTPGA